MIFTKTQIKILRLLVSNVGKRYSILSISKQIKQSYPLTYNSTKELIKKEYISKDEHNLIKINIENIQDLAYIESLKSESFLNKNKNIKIFLDELTKKTDYFFILLIFGSYASNKQTKNSDIDILIILNSQEKAEKEEKFLNREADIYLNKHHIITLGIENIKEMLKDNKINVFKETLDNHIILYGAEHYLKLIKNA